MRRRILALLLACLALISFSACRHTPGFSGGETLTKTEMEALRNSLLSEEYKNEVNDPEELPDDAECYFISGEGDVYHTKKDCSYIQSAKKLTFGTLEEAADAGKTRACTACAKTSDVEAEPLLEEVLARGCYYVPGGSVWHYDAACSAISKSKGVINATVREAIAQGKSRACSRCDD